LACEVSTNYFRSQRRAKAFSQKVAEDKTFCHQNIPKSAILSANLLTFWHLSTDFLALVRLSPIEIIERLNKQKFKNKTRN